MGILEDMIRNPAAEFRKVLEFLQIDPDWQPQSFDAYNTAHGARSVFIRRVLNGSVPQWFVWRGLPRVIGDTRTRELVRDFRHSWFHRKNDPEGQDAAELRRQLEDDFMPDVTRLSHMLGRDLGELWFKRPVLGTSQRRSKSPVTAS